MHWSLERLSLNSSINFKNTTLKKKLNLIKKIKNINSENIINLRQDLLQENMNQFYTEIIDTILNYKINSLNDIKNIIRILSVYIKETKFLKLFSNMINYNLWWHRVVNIELFIVNNIEYDYCIEIFKLYNECEYENKVYILEYCIEFFDIDIDINERKVDIDMKVDIDNGRMVDIDNGMVDINERKVAINDSKVDSKLKKFNSIKNKLQEFVKTKIHEINKILCDIGICIDKKNSCSQSINNEHIKNINTNLQYKNIQLDKLTTERFLNSCRNIGLTVNEKKNEFKPIINVGEHEFDFYNIRKENFKGGCTKEESLVMDLQCVKDGWYMEEVHRDRLNIGGCCKDGSCIEEVYRDGSCMEEVRVDRLNIGGCCKNTVRVNVNLLDDVNCGRCKGNAPLDELNIGGSRKDIVRSDKTHKDTDDALDKDKKRTNSFLKDKLHGASVSREATSENTVKNLINKIGVLENNSNGTKKNFISMKNVLNNKHLSTLNKTVTNSNNLSTNNLNVNNLQSNKLPINIQSNIRNNIQSSNLNKKIIQSNIQNNIQPKQINIHTNQLPNNIQSNIQSHIQSNIQNTTKFPKNNDLVSFIKSNFSNLKLIDDLSKHLKLPENQKQIPLIINKLRNNLYLVPTLARIIKNTGIICKKFVSKLLDNTCRQVNNGNMDYNNNKGNVEMRSSSCTSSNTLFSSNTASLSTRQNSNNTAFSSTRQNSNTTAFSSTRQNSSTTTRQPTNNINTRINTVNTKHNTTRINTKHNTIQNTDLSRSEIINNLILITELAKFKYITPTEIFNLLDTYSKDIELFCLIFKQIGRFYLSDENTNYKLREYLDKIIIYGSKCSQIECVYINDMMSSVFYKQKESEDNLIEFLCYYLSGGDGDVNRSGNGALMSVGVGGSGNRSGNGYDGVNIINVDGVDGVDDINIFHGSASTSDTNITSNSSTNISDTNSLSSYSSSNTSNTNNISSYGSTNTSNPTYITSNTTTTSSPSMTSTPSMTNILTKNKKFLIHLLLTPWKYKDLTFISILSKSLNIDNSLIQIITYAISLTTDNSKMKTLSYAKLLSLLLPYQPIDNQRSIIKNILNIDMSSETKLRVLSILLESNHEIRIEYFEYFRDESIKCKCRDIDNLMFNLYEGSECYGDSNNYGDSEFIGDNNIYRDDIDSTEEEMRYLDVL